MLAFDLAHLLAPAEVSAALADSTAMADAVVDVKQAAGVLASILGVRLETEIKAAPQAQLLIAFDEDPSILSAVAKSLLVEILSNHGAQIEGIAGWNAHSEQNSIILEGELSQSGLRRVLSVVSGPVGPWTNSYEDATSTENVMVETSRN